MEKLVEMQRVEKVCLNCGHPFEVVRSREDTAKYCSNMCRREGERRGLRPQGYRYDGGKVPTKEELEELYYKRGFSATRIGELYGKGKNFIYYRMTRYHLKRRLNQAQALAQQKILNCNFPLALVKLINEDAIVNYVFAHMKEFGYERVLLWRTAEYDMIGIRQDGKLERIEIEAHSAHFVSHHHKCDRVIAYYKTKHNLGVPITYLKRNKFLHYLNKVLGDFKCVFPQI
jgi:hypothetical protein